jgi:Flp pilus assembly protein TadG
MRAFQKLVGLFFADARGAVALNTGLALIPLMIALSFALERLHA